MAKIVLSTASYLPYEEKMKTTLKVLDAEFNTIRAGRANPRLLDSIHVNYYGTESPLQQVATVQVPEARCILITPWDAKVLKDIEKAIQASDLGINPMNDGKCIRLNFPQLTEERRKELVKGVAKLGEDSKVAIRNVRREGIEVYRSHLKQKELSEDDLFEFEEAIQKLTDRYIEKVDKAVAGKEKELMDI